MAEVPPSPRVWPLSISWPLTESANCPLSEAARSNVALKEEKDTDKEADWKESMTTDEASGEYQSHFLLF